MKTLLQVPVVYHDIVSKDAFEDHGKWTTQTVR
jgi:hypothetical protein